MKGQTYIVLALVFAVVVAIFAVINVDPVEVNYLFGTGYAPLILVILVSVLMGGLITAAVGVVRVIKLQREIRNLKLELKKYSDSVETEENIEVEGNAELDEEESNEWVK